MNNKQIEVIASYGIYCLNRQEQLLNTYRKLRREYVDLTFILLGILASITVDALSIWCAVTRLVDAWVPAMITIAIGALVVMLVVSANVTAGHITKYKQFIAESRDVNNTLTDITDVINLLEDREGTEEDEQ